MKLSIPQPEIKFSTHSRTLSLGLANGFIKAVQKSNPKSFSLEDAVELANDIEVLETALKDQIDVVNEATKALRSYPHDTKLGHPLIAACADLATQVAIAKELNNSDEYELPSIDDQAHVLVEYSDGLEHSMVSLQRKKLNILSKVRAGFALTLSKAKDLSFLNENKSWVEFLPHGAVRDKKLLKMELGRPNFIPETPLDHPDRAASVLVKGILDWLADEEAKKEKRITLSKNRTRSEKLENITKSLQEKL